MTAPWFPRMSDKPKWTPEEERRVADAAKVSFEKLFELFRSSVAEENADDVLAAIRPMIEALPAGTPIPFPKESVIAILDSQKAMERTLDEVMLASERAIARRDDRLVQMSKAVDSSNDLLKKAGDALARETARRSRIASLLRRARPFVEVAGSGEASDVLTSIDAVLAAEPGQVR